MTSSEHLEDLPIRVSVKAPYRFSRRKSGDVILERRSLHWQFLPVILLVVVFGFMKLGWEITSFAIVGGAILGWAFLSTQPFKVHAQAGSVDLLFKVLGLTRKKTIPSDSLECFLAKPWFRKALNGTEFNFARVDLVLADGSSRKLYEVITSTYTEAQQSSEQLATAFADAVGISVAIETQE